jgi:hypothetical protein
VGLTRLPRLGRLDVEALADGDELYLSVREEIGQLLSELGARR